MVLSPGLLRRVPQLATLRRKMVAEPLALCSRAGPLSPSLRGRDGQRRPRLSLDGSRDPILAATRRSYLHSQTGLATDTKKHDAQHDAQHQQQQQLQKSEEQKVTVHEDIYTIPNILTFTRIAVAPFVGYLVLQDAHSWAFGLLAYAGVTDLLDGWIARRWNRRTVVGTVIDPMADKALMTILTVCLAVKGALPVWLATIILGRDVGLAISAIYFRWISLPPPKTFARYWDFSLPSAEVRPTTISKYNTFFQLALVGLTTAAPLLSVDIAPALTYMQYVVAATTIWSGASYIYTKDAVKILNSKTRT